MEELRLSLLIFGGCAILGILAHGIWSIRKNSKAREQHSSDLNKLQSPDPDDPLIDNLSPDDPLLDESVVDGAQPSVVIEPEWDADVEPFSADGDVIHKIDDRFENTGFDAVAEGTQFDELGIGQVRVVSRSAIADETDGDVIAEPVVAAPATESSAEPKPLPKRYASVVTQPKPEMAKARDVRGAGDNKEMQQPVPEPPGFLLRQDSPESSGTEEQAVPEVVTSSEKRYVVEQPVQSQPKPAPAPTQAQIQPTSQPVTEPAAKPAIAPTFSGDEAPAQEDTAQLSFAEQAKKLVQRNKSANTRRQRREPQLGEDQLKIDFDESQQPKANIDEGAVEKPQTKPAFKQEVLVLNVKAADDSPIPGAALLPMLLTLGFKFGDQDIFHRHVNSNGKGPVLFSLANMFKPGVFDIDNMENFTTQGISLFMILPIEGDPHQVFNMMHNAARKIADEFSAQVLDGRRSLLTKQSLQQYVEKIREFERQRMLTR